MAAVPDECAGQFGPQLAALIAYLTVVCRLPRLVVQRLLADVLQIPLSLESTQHAWEEASAAVAAPYKELRQALANQPVLNADETGHRTNGAKRWLWTLVAPTFVFYTIATSRGADVLRHLLGTAFAGVLGSDRLSTYLTYPAGVGAQPFGCDEAAVGSLATVTAAGARSRHEIKGPSEVQDEVSRGELVSVRAGLGPARGRG